MKKSIKRKANPVSIHCSTRQPKKPKHTAKEVAALKAKAITLWKADNSHAWELGMALLAVRAALTYQHGAFKKWWQENELSQARVSYCMRLASGKVEAAKEKQRSPFEGAALVTKQIRKEMNDFLAYAVHFDFENGDKNFFFGKFAHLIGRTLERFGTLPGWQMRDTHHLHVELASKSFVKSLNYLMRCLYNKKTPLEEDETPEKKPVASATA